MNHRRITQSYPQVQASSSGVMPLLAPARRAASMLHIPSRPAPQGFAGALPRTRDVAVLGLLALVLVVSWFVRTPPEPAADIGDTVACGLQ